MVGTEAGAKQAVETQYWDSCIFLALLKRETNHELGELDYILDQAARFDRNELVLVTSTIAVTEILDAGFNHEQKSAIEAMFLRTNFVFVEANLAACRLASEIRSYYVTNPVITPSPKHLGVTTPDAIHLASAIIAGNKKGAVKLLTFDCADKPKRRELGMTRLNGMVANRYPLTIFRPSEAIAAGGWG
jgi:hypothetical protein